MAIVDIGVGLAGNDGTGDSIRDAFIKTNSNFQYLDEATKNLVTGNLTVTGNVTFATVRDSYWTGNFYLNGVEVATVNNLFDGGTVANITIFQNATQATANTTGAVQITGGLGVAKNSYLTDVFAKSLTVAENITTTSFNSAGGIFTGDVATGALSVAGTHTVTGNISGANMSANTAVFTNVQGRIITNAQPFITSLGTLTELSTTGNIEAANLTLSGVGKLTAVEASLSGAITVAGNIESAANAVIAGNITGQNISAGIGNFDSATVNNIPSNFHVTNKGYVNSTVVAFALGLGS
jgi:cytoskeletal protein CcmA (bactofilin family)